MCALDGVVNIACWFVVHNGLIFFPPSVAVCSRCDKESQGVIVSFAPSTNAEIVRLARPSTQISNQRFMNLTFRLLRHPTPGILSFIYRHIYGVLLKAACARVVIKIG